LRTRVYNSSFKGYLDVNVNRDIARGRLVLGGGTYPDSTMRLRLRIIYSDLWFIFACHLKKQCIKSCWIIYRTYKWVTQQKL